MQLEGWPDCISTFSYNMCAYDGCIILVGFRCVWQYDVIWNDVIWCHTSDVSFLQKSAIAWLEVPTDVPSPTSGRQFSGSYFGCPLGSQNKLNGEIKKDHVLNLREAFNVLCYLSYEIPQLFNLYILEGFDPRAFQSAASQLFPCSTVSRFGRSI